MHFRLTTVVFLLPVLSGAVPVASNGGDLQPFTGALGGILPIPVTNSGDAKRPFAVDGTTDVNIGAALQRSCAVQHNQCAQAANANKNIEFSVGDCDAQQQQCNAAGQGAPNTGASSDTASAVAVAATASAPTGNGCAAAVVGTSGY